MVYPEKTQDEKAQDAGPRAEVHVKRMISVSPDSYIFPYIEKCINWDIWFSLIHSNYLGEKTPM